MPDQLAMRCAAQSGVVTTSDALACGYTRQRLAALVTSRTLLRITSGAYVDRRLFEAAAPEGRHALRTRALVAAFDGRVVASHHSALALLDVPLFGAPLSQVHVTRRGDHHTRRREGLTVHGGYGWPDALTTAGLTPSVVPALAVLGTAMVCGVEAGVVAADAALARGVVTAAELALWQGRLPRGSRLARAAEVVRVADARAESVGESRLRFLFRALGWSPTSQGRIVDTDGSFVARVDFLFEPERVVVEFDGLLKYDGALGRERLVAEKLREDRVRALGYEVVRLVWADLSHPDLVRARVSAALERAARRLVA